MLNQDVMSSAADAVRSAAQRLEDFFRHESTGGLLLIVAAAVALVLANSSLADEYRDFLAIPFAVSAGDFSIDKPLVLWINDGLMGVFFLLVALEIKREILHGELSSPSQLATPLVAAIGGAAVPALIYVAINWGDADAMQGWAIPTATDIAFALGLLSLLGSRAPVALKILLSTIAVIDDLLAIIIIAIFYTADLAPVALLVAGLLVAVLVVMNRMGVRRLAPYLLVGAVLWVSVLKSGVHATLAGVIIGLCIPMRGEGSDSPLERLEHQLSPWVGYLILPLFAFANAGVPLIGSGMAALVQPVPLGIALGLLLGKPLGVFGSTWVGVKLGLLSRPAGLSWSSLFGVALLCGIGFTMSLFIGALAFEHGAARYAELNRMGILAGSCVAATAGLLWLWLTLPKAGVSSDQRMSSSGDS